MEARCFCNFRSTEVAGAPAIVRGIPVCRPECIERARQAPDTAPLLARQNEARTAAARILASLEPKEERTALLCRECHQLAPCKACQFHEWKVAHMCAQCGQTRRYIWNVLPTLIGTLRFCDDACQWRFFCEKPGLWPRITGEPEGYGFAYA